MPKPGRVRRARPTVEDFQHLLAFRITLRRFQHWSERQAIAVGLTPAQHQLLVAIKGHPGRLAPTIGELAASLLLRHHSTVELVDRAVAADLVSREADAADARLVRVNLTGRGDRLVIKLTQAHLAELRKLAVALYELEPYRDDDDGQSRGAAGESSSAPG